MSRNDTLQSLCRDYLGRLRYMAKKHGLGGFVRDTIKANAKGECSATEYELQMLSRLCNDERVSRKDIPTIVGKTYRQCCDDGTFDRIKTLKRVGIYSKVSAMLYKTKKVNKNDERTKK